MYSVQVNRTNSSFFHHYHTHIPVGARTVESGCERRLTQAGCVVSLVQLLMAEVVMCCGVTSDKKQCKFGRQLSLSSRSNFHTLLSSVQWVFTPGTAGRQNYSYCLLHTVEPALRLACETDLAADPHSV